MKQRGCHPAWRVAIALSVMISACGGGGSGATAVSLSDAGTASPAIPTTPVVTPMPIEVSPNGAFNGTWVMGSPTTDAVVFNVHSADQAGNVTLDFGVNSLQYDQQVPTAALQIDKPLELRLQNLKPATRYFYRLRYQASNTKEWVLMPEYEFQTAKPPGQSFVFAIQGDSHPERLKTQFDADLYKRTLLRAAADKPDFYILSGDDFSVDTLNPATITATQVRERYTLQRPYLSLIGRTSPLFLVNGNHEQAARYLLDGTPNNVAVWAQNARNSFYSQPAPDAFYSGNLEQVPFIGLLRNYFAWTWGDALFVVIDPYWASPVAVDNQFGGASKRQSMWDVTHGDAQYNWLKRTLEQSKAKHKFVFAHHVMGTGRGGIELAKLWEWGGESQNGQLEFAAQRPSWTTPIHQLMVANKVSIFFQGHDHIWVRQKLDGVTYQTLSQPADPNYTLWNSDAYLSGDKFPNTGYTRVTVNPSQVKVEYVKTYLQKDEGPGKVHGEVAFSYTLP
jgi:hypothetical protein